jgi:hypothetical protein
MSDRDDFYKPYFPVVKFNMIGQVDDPGTWIHNDAVRRMPKRPRIYQYRKKTNRKTGRTYTTKIRIASLGGQAKAAKGYQSFVDWIARTGFPIKQYKEASARNLVSAFKLFDKTDRFRTSAPTALKYRKRYLKLR